MHMFSGPALCLTLAAALFGCTSVETSTEGGDDAVTPDGTEPEPDAPLECPPGHAGDDCGSCADGYRDGDGDGTCAPSCAATGKLTFDCGPHGACVDDAVSDARSCACDAGYLGDSCEACAPGYRPDPDDPDPDGATVCTLALPSTTSLALWLDTTVPLSLGLSAGNAVATWEDRRGSGVTVTAPSVGARPGYVEASLNGRPVVRFSGDDDLVAGLFNGLHGADYTIFVVLRPGPPSADVVLRTSNGELGTTLRFERLPLAHVYRLRHDVPLAGTGDQVSASFSDASSTKVLMLRRRTSGAVGDHMQLVGNNADALDGVDVLQGTLVEGPIDVSHDLHIGDADLQGDLAELLIYDRGVGNPEAAEIRAYLAAKWGVL